MGASHRGSFPYLEAQALGCDLSHCSTQDSQAVVHIGLPDQGLNLSPVLAAGFLIIGPPGMSLV